MMLRAKTGISKVHIFNHSYNRRFKVKLNDYLTAKQQKNLATKPDFMWQFAQHLKKNTQRKVIAFLSIFKVKLVSMGNHTNLLSIPKKI